MAIRGEGEDLLRLTAQGTANPKLRIEGGGGSGVDPMRGGGDDFAPVEGSRCDHDLQAVGEVRVDLDSLRLSREERNSEIRATVGGQARHQTVPCTCGSASGVEQLSSREIRGKRLLKSLMRTHF